jgi:ATP-dependent protease ClpP protease subunit
MKNWYAIKAAAQGSDTAEVSILSEIGMWGVNAATFLGEFRAIQAPNVKLFINSPGGSVFDALAIFNGMRATGKNIEVHVLGIAASAASYIAMAGHKVVMPANTMMFLHNPINAVYGNADDMREMADILDKLGASLTATYAKRFKGEASVLDQLMADESYLTAAECLEYGFCDEVTEEIAATALFDVDRLPENVQALFKAAAVVPVTPAAVVPAEPLADAVAALAKDAQLEAFAAVFVTDPAVTDLASAAAVIHTAREITSLAKHAGLEASAAQMIRDRKTLAEARQALSEVLEAASPHVDTAARSANLHPVNTTDWSPKSLWNDIKAMKAGSKK